MKPLVLIHGLLLSGWIFTRMQRYFEARHYQVMRFNYPSREKTISQTANVLNEWLVNKQIIAPDFICHSLGGLVCLTYFKEYVKKSSPQANVVCLGSPFQGSMVARSLSQSKAGKLLVGVQSQTALTTGLKSWPDNSTLGIIAGNKNIGSGRFLGLDTTRPGDGTVLVQETGIQGASDHIILPVSHSGMTFSTAVFQQAECFLNHQKFNHDAL